jgi:hypothetical protein
MVRVVGRCRVFFARNEGRREIFSGPAKLAMVQPVAIAFNQSPDEVFLAQLSI